MLNTFKEHWVKSIVFLATVTIPILVWFSGLFPDFVRASELKIYEQRLTELDVKQTDLAVDFKRTEREDVERRRLHLEREIFNLRFNNEHVPPFYLEQRLQYEQQIEKLNQEIEDLRGYRLNILRPKGE